MSPRHQFFCVQPLLLLRGINGVRCPLALAVILTLTFFNILEATEAIPSTYFLAFDGNIAHCTAAHPPLIRTLVDAANSIVGCPYRYGAGHQRVYEGQFDCSGALSYILMKGHLLTEPLTSREFQSYGIPGPGRYLTIFVKPGHHVFMSICGLRFDTSGGSFHQGPRWRPTARPWQDFILRHPPGL